MEEQEELLGGDGAGIRVSTLDYSVENHFKAMDMISKLCGETETDSCCSKDFVMYVGGSVWTLDWCPRVHERPDCHIKRGFGDYTGEKEELEKGQRKNHPVMMPQRLRGRKEDLGKSQQKKHPVMKPQRRLF